MFKIVQTRLSPPFLHGTDPTGSLSGDALSTFCVSEGWSGDLSTGLMQIGETSALLHGIEPGNCGLLNLVRAYDTNDRVHILELFEQAASSSSSFCFSTTMLQPHGSRQPLFCIAQSSGLERRYSGLMEGVFFFPNFQTDALGRGPQRQ